MDYSKSIIDHIEHLKHYTVDSIDSVNKSLIPELLKIQWEEVSHYFLDNKRYDVFDNRDIKIFKITNMRYYTGENNKDQQMFQENAYKACTKHLLPAFALFINRVFIPLTDITIARNHRYTYFTIRNLAKFKDTIDTIHIISIPFNVKYTEIRKTTEGYTELFRFDDNGLYSPSGRFVYSFLNDKISITTNTLAIDSVINHYDLYVDKGYMLNNSNMILFKDGFLDVLTEREISTMNLLTLANGNPLTNNFTYKLIYDKTINKSISNVMVPENDTYMKQLLSGQSTDPVDISGLEENFSFKFDNTLDYETNINNSLNYIATYRHSLLNDILIKASKVKSYIYTGKEFKALAKNNMVRMLRARHHLYDTYVMIFKNNELYENYQYLFYEANAWRMPINPATIDDKDIFEIVYFNFVNNVVIKQNLQADNRWITHCPFFPEELQITSDYIENQVYNMTPTDKTRYKVDFKYELDGKKVIISLDNPNYYEPAIFNPNPDDFHAVNWTLHWDANYQLQFYSGSVLAMTLFADGKLATNEFILPYDDDSEDFVIGDWTLHQTVFDELLFIYKADYTAMTINGFSGNVKVDHYSDEEDRTNVDPSTFIDKVDIGNGWYLAEDESGHLRFGNEGVDVTPAILYDKEMFTSDDLDEKTMVSESYEPKDNYIQINEDWQIYAESAFRLIILYKRMSKVIIQADGKMFTLNEIDESYNTTDYSYAGDSTGTAARIDKKHPVGKGWYLADDTKKQLRFMCHEDETISVLTKPGKLYLNEMLNQNFVECYINLHEDDLRIGDWVIHYNGLGELLFVHQESEDFEGLVPASFNANGEIRTTEYSSHHDLINPEGEYLDKLEIGNGWSIVEDSTHKLRFINSNVSDSALIIDPDDIVCSSNVEESSDNPVQYSDITENIIRVGEWAFYAKSKDELVVLYNDAGYITINSDGVITTINGLLENYPVHAVMPYPDASEFTIIGDWRIYAADADHLKFLYKDYCLLTITSESQYILPGSFTEYLNRITRVKLTPMVAKNIKIYVDDKWLYSPMLVTRDKYVTLRAEYEGSTANVDLYIKTDSMDELRGENLWLSSIHQFRYICYNINKKNAAFDLGYDFAECLDINRFMVFINGKALNDTQFRVLLPSIDTPFTEPCVHTSVMAYPGDRVEIFYLPCPCKTIDVNNFDVVTTNEITVEDPTILSYDIPFPIPNYTAGRNGFVVMLKNIIIPPEEYTVENNIITFKSLDVNVDDKITFVFFYNERVTPETYDEEDLPNMESYGYIYLDKNKLSHTLTRDLYFLFINGRKVERDSILDISSNIFRVKRDIRSRSHIALLDHAVHIPQLENLKSIMSKYDLVMNKIAYILLNKLFKKYNIISDTTPRVLNNISQEALINDIVRYHYASQTFAQSLPFIFTYDTKYYTNKDEYGNYIIGVLDANKQNFPDYPHE